MLVVVPGRDPLPVRLLMHLAGRLLRSLYHPMGGPAAIDVEVSSNTNFWVLLKSTGGVCEALSSSSLKFQPNPALELVAKDKRLLSALPPPRLRLPPPRLLRWLRDD